MGNSLRVLNADFESRETKKLKGAKQKAALNAATQLEKASDAMGVYLDACRELEQDPKSHDSRILLVRDMTEFANYLRSVHQG